MLKTMLKMFKTHAITAIWCWKL